MNHASSEMLERIYNLNDAKLSCPWLARTMHHSHLLVFKVNFSLKKICKYKN